MGSRFQPAQGKYSLHWMTEAGDLSCAEIIDPLQRVFGKTQCTIFRRCIAAPLLKQGIFAVVRCQYFSPLLSQCVQSLLGGPTMEEEDQQLHHVIIDQQGRST